MRKRAAIIFAISLLLLPFNISAKTIVKYFQFSVPPQGAAYFSVNVPNGATKVKAVVTYHTNQVDMKILGPTNAILCENSTLYSADWKQSLVCETQVGNDRRNSPGKWQIMIKGAVPASEAASVSNVSGSLTVYIEMQEKKSVRQQVKVDTSSLVFDNTFDFNFTAQGNKSFELIIPSSVKNVRIKVFRHNSKIKVRIKGPKGDILWEKDVASDTATDWHSPVICTLEVGKNPRQSPGIWKVIILPSAQCGKDEQPYITGKLNVKYFKK